MARFLFKLFSLVILTGLLAVSVSNADYLDTETSAGNTFAAGCWSPPDVPELVSPADNSYTNEATIILDWNDSGFICPNQTVEYLYELNGEESVWQTETAANLTLGEGVYGWRVKAKTDNHESAYSDLWTVTVDRTAPQTALTFNGKTINESVANGGFENGMTGWQVQGQVVRIAADAYAAPVGGTRMVRIGHRSGDAGNEIWENRLRQRINPGAKNLSFYYNFFSLDSGLDDPGMVVRLNDYNVFYLSAGEIENDSPDDPNSSGWTQLSFDISQIPDPVLEIVFYSGNTGDGLNQSWVYIDNVSTAEAVAEGGTDFALAANEPGDSYYSFTGVLPFTLGGSFNLSTITGSTNVYYYSVDRAGNAESTNTRRLVKDITAPVSVTDLEALGNSKQSVNLSWTAPAEASLYDLRYSLSPIDEANFPAAAAVPNPPAPRKAGDPQAFDVTGLDSNTIYYFALKTGDAALNWSGLSNVVSAATLDEISEDPDLNPGDVVINELMWMGTSRSAADEYLELRNMTDRTIDLSGWSVAGVTIPSGKTITPKGYFLITNFNKVTSRINVDPNLVRSALSLPNSNARYVLRDSASTIIDTADNGLNSPAAGVFNPGVRYWSMERDATPGNGENADVWHTCLDNSDLMRSYWDSGTSECGTPGRENLSQTAATGSAATLFHGNNLAGFTVANLSRFNLLTYRLTYDSAAGEQGIVGSIALSGQDQIEVNDLVLGTCSSGGACVYHEGISELKLQIELTGAINRTITESLKL